MHDDCESCSNPDFDPAQHIWDLLRRRGFAVVPVLGDACNPGFAYTVGLTLVDHPELILYGLPPERQAPILHDLAERVVDGERLLAGSRVVLSTGERAAVLACTAEAATHHLVFANRMLSVDARLPALQVVWPDSVGRLPWESGYDAGDERQPLLGRPPRLPLARPT